MNDEAIAFQEPVRHLHLIDADVRYLHRNDLRFRCETNCLKFDLFSAEKPWLEILQRQHNTKPQQNTRPGRVRILFFSHYFLKSSFSRFRAVAVCVLKSTAKWRTSCPPLSSRHDHSSWMSSGFCRKTAFSSVRSPRSNL